MLTLFLFCFLVPCCNYAMNKYLFVPVKFAESEVFCVFCHCSINKVFGLEIAELVRFPVER